MVDGDGGDDRGGAATARRRHHRRRHHRLASPSPVGVTLAVGVPLLLLDDLIVFVSDNLLQVRPQKAVLLLEAAPDDAAAEEEQSEDWRQLYKNRSSRKIDSRRLFSRE